MKFSDLFSQYKGLRREIYVLFFGRIVTNLGSMVWPMLTMILNQKLGMDASGIAVLMTASMVLMLPVSLAGGKLADRLNKKHIIIICDFISVVCYILCGVLPLGYITVGLMLAASLCQSMEYPAYNSLFADLTTTADRERAFSLQYLGGNLGLVLSPTIAGLLFKDYLWLSFIISGAAIGCSTLLIAFFVKNITPERDESEAAVYQQSKESVGLLRILRDNRVIIVFLVIMSLYYAAYGQYNYLMPLDLGRVHGDTGALIFGTVSSLNCIIVVIFTPLITRLFRRFNEVKKILTGQLLVLAGYVVFLLLLGFVPAYYGAMLMFTWGEIFATIAEGPYISCRIPASHRGRINALSTVVGTTVGGVFDLAVGGLYDNAGSTAAWCSVFGVLAVAAILTAFLIRHDRKSYPKLYEK